MTNNVQSPSFKKSVRKLLKKRYMSELSKLRKLKDMDIELTVPQSYKVFLSPYTCYYKGLLSIDRDYKNQASNNISRAQCMYLMSYKQALDKLNMRVDQEMVINNTVRLKTRLKELLEIIEEEEEYLLDEMQATYLCALEIFANPKNFKKLAKDKSLIKNFPWPSDCLPGALLLSIADNLQNEVRFPREITRRNVEKRLSSRLEEYEEITLRIHRKLSGHEKEFFSKSIENIIKNSKIHSDNSWFSFYGFERGYLFSLVGIAHIIDKDPLEAVGMLLPSDAASRDTISSVCGYAYNMEVLEDEGERGQSKGAIFKHENQKTKVEVRIPRTLEMKGYSTSIQADSTNGEESALALYMIENAFGSASARDLFAILLMNLQAGVAANQAIWWHESEHLAIIGQDPNSTERRRALRKRIANMAEIQLSVTSKKTNKGLTFKLISRPDNDRMRKQNKGYERLLLHPSLYNGIRQEDGKQGSRFWPILLDLLEANANKEGKFLFSGAFYFACLFSTVMREIREDVWGFEKKIGVDKVMKGVGIHKKNEKSSDEEKQESLELLLQSLCQYDILREYRISDCQKFVTVKPGEFSCESIERKRNFRSFPCIPQTIGDMKDFFQSNKWTLKEAAEEISVGYRTLARVVKESGEEPIPVKTKRAIREYLWPR